jgi:hypothetical protein
MALMAFMLILPSRGVDDWHLQLKLQLDGDWLGALRSDVRLQHDSDMEIRICLSGIETRLDIVQRGAAATAASLVSKFCFHHSPCICRQ